MPILEKGTDKRYVDESEVAALEAKGWSRRAGDKRTIKSEYGSERLVDHDDAEVLLAEGGQEVDTFSRDVDRLAAAREERAYGDEDVAAFGQAGLSAITFGGSDFLTEDLHGEGSGAAIARQNQPATMAGSIVGAVAGGVGGTLKGGLGKALAYTPAGMAGRAGAGVTKALGGGTAAVVAGNAAEGALFGGGEAISSMLLHDKELSAEAIASDMGAGAIFGGVLGSVGIGLGKLGTKMKAKNVKAVALESDAVKGITSSVSKQAEDLGAAARSIQADLKAVDAATRKSLAKPVQIIKDEGRRIQRILGDKPEKYMQNLAKLDDAQFSGFVESFKKYQVNVEQVSAKFGRQVTAAPIAGVDDALKAAGAKSSSVGDVSALAESFGLTDVAKHLSEAGAGTETVESLTKLWALSKVTHGVDDAVGAAAGAVGRPGKLFKGKRAVEDRGAMHRPHTAWARAARHGVKNWANPVAAMGAMVGGAANAVGKVKNAVGKGFTKALSNGRTLRRGYIPASSTILSRVSFDPDIGKKPDKTPVSKPTTKRQAYEMRAAELRKAVADPAGTRAALEKRLAPIASMDREVYSAVLEHAMRKINFLGSKVTPVRQGLAGPRRDATSDTQIDKFTRWVQGAEDPLSLMDDLEAGRITFEAVEALKEVNPTIYREMQMAVAELPEEQLRELSYGDRVQLTIMFDVPTDPSLQPEAIKMLQDGYAERAAEQEQGNKDFSTPGQVGQGVGLTAIPTAVQKLEM